MTVDILKGIPRWYIVVTFVLSVVLAIFGAIHLTEKMDTLFAKESAQPCDGSIPSSVIVKYHPDYGYIAMLKTSFVGEEGMYLCRNYENKGYYQFISTNDIRQSIIFFQDTCEVKAALKKTSNLPVPWDEFKVVSNTDTSMWTGNDTIFSIINDTMAFMSVINRSRIQDSIEDKKLKDLWDAK